MFLTKHLINNLIRWALNGKYLSPEFNFKKFLTLSLIESVHYLAELSTGTDAEGELLAPVEDDHEVWASGVTYSRSRDEREAETDIKDVYEKVYNAKRPELFFKAIGWRVKGSGSPIRIRKDSSWNVPEPELTLLINSSSEIIGYCAGNDVSSRHIEGENPLYLPQAKMYNGSCAIGPGIVLTDVDNMRDLAIRLIIERSGKTIYEDKTKSSKMKRSLEELVSYLTLEMDFPFGVYLMTGTGIVPEKEFSLNIGDKVIIAVDQITLENVVES